MVDKRNAGAQHLAAATKCGARRFHHRGVNMAAKPKTPKRKTAKTAKTPVKRSAKSIVEGAIAGPLPKPPENVIFVTEDGQLVVATSAGQIAIVTDEALAEQLKLAIGERQRAAADLTQMLENAGYFVIAGSTTGHRP